MPGPRRMPSRPKRSRPPQPVVGDGPSGPDAGRVRSLHETRRRALKAKAETAGAMPGTGSVGRHGGITRASYTQDQYLARGRIMLKRYRREIGRASCRERVCQYVKITVVEVSLQKKHKHKKTRKHITKLNYI